MIEHGRSVADGSDIECDVCIIGSGPAGVTLALELQNIGGRVVLLEAGDKAEDAVQRGRLAGVVVPEGSHEPLEDNRRRVLGGTSAAWGGRCIPLDPIDLQRREWIGDSGWPIGFQELQEHYAKASAYCEIGAPHFDAEDLFAGGQKAIIAGLDSEEIRSSRIERWGPPTHFGKRYLPELSHDAELRVLLGSTATSLTAGGGTRSVERVNVSVSPTHRFTVRPRLVVLAAGAIENARILLNSTGEVACGIGNEGGNVGRFYMSHLAGVHAWAALTDPDNESFKYEFERDGDVYIRRRIWITPQTQERERIGNFIVTFNTPYADDTASALSSAVYLFKVVRDLRRKSLRQGLRHLADSRAPILANSRRVAMGLPRLAPQVASAIHQKYFARRRLPILLPRRRDLGNRFFLAYQAEHRPNRLSQVRLGDRQDDLGVPIPEVHVAFTDEDIRTVVKGHGIVARRLQTSGLGRLHYNEAELEDHVRARIRNFNSAAHQLGTTRMSASSADGVVDADCRVHGYGNLFVAGGSVFATSGHANPTLTIVALAIRLARHIRRRLR